MGKILHSLPTPHKVWLLKKMEVMHDVTAKSPKPVVLP
jgi:hypothetical protein